MPSPLIAEDSSMVGLQSSEVLFLRPFGVETTIWDAATEMTDTFRAVGDLSRHVMQVTTHVPRLVEASLGILDQRLSIETDNREVRMRDVRVAPMGANGFNILLGVFKSSRLTEVNKSILFGDVPSEGFTEFAYATFSASHARAGGLGYMAMRGRIAVFSQQPSTEQLVALVNSETPSYARPGPFPISRIDMSKEQAESERNSRRSQRHSR